ncbi:hypothetical protein HMPREF1592_04348, partial [Escherichia coli 907357]
RFIPAGAGNTERRRLAGFARRFIPAGAGNTSASASVNIPVTVYPRWRGEHRAIASSMFTTFGLSPLARGTHDAAMSFSWASRFIPAGAGNTADRSV